MGEQIQWGGRRLEKREKSDERVAFSTFLSKKKGEKGDGAVLSGTNLSRQRLSEEMGKSDSSETTKDFPLFCQIRDVFPLFVEERTRRGRVG